MNSILVAWIMSSIEPNLRSILGYRANAKTLWDEAKERFSNPDTIRVHELRL